MVDITGHLAFGLLFAYILGPILFGWYGSFLLPIVFVLMLELVRVVPPQLLRGEPIDSTPSVAEDAGASSADMLETDDDEASEADDSGTEGDDLSSTNDDATLDDREDETADDDLAYQAPSLAPSTAVIPDR